MDTFTAHVGLSAVKAFTADPVLNCCFSQDYYDYMLSYSPVDNIQETAYPNMLVLAGLHDPRYSLPAPTAPYEQLSK